MVLRAVWVTPLAPAFRGGGGQIRQAHLLEALASEARVHLVSAEAVDDERVLELVDAIDVVEAHPAVRGRSGAFARRVRDLAGAVRGVPREVDDYRFVRERLRRAALDAARAADVVLVEYAGLAPLLADLGDVPTVLTLHNLPSRMSRHAAGIAAGRRQRWLYERDAAAAAASERQWAAVATTTIVVSEDDRRVLGAAAAVVPNGVDTKLFDPSPVPSEPLLLFVGALHTEPNVDAARWLVTDILPRVRAHVPDARLELVGARPTPEVEQLAASHGVRLLADVDDVAPHVARARVVAVPIRIGSGTRLKALEALAAHRPVVGTTIGVEGLGLHDGDDVLVADDAESFSRCVAAVLEDDGLASRLATNGHRIATDHDWSRIRGEFVRVVLGVTSAAG